MKQVDNGYTGRIWRGVDYSPTWPGWVVGVNGTQTGDSDFANDAFQSLWANAYMAAPANDTSVPVDNGTNYRDDLRTIAEAGYNLVRLYDWDMARGTTETSNVGLDHINFLDYADSLGLKIVVPVSDYFLSGGEYAWNGKPDTIPADYAFSHAYSDIQTDFTQFVASITDPTTGNVHAAIHSIDVGNEGDLGQGIAGTTPSHFLYRTIWWIVNLHQQINGTGNGPDGNPVTNPSGPVVQLTATFSNGDQGLGIGSWFNCLIEGVKKGQATPTVMNGDSSFADAVTGLKAADADWASYYYNSTNISQGPTGLAATLALYDSGASPWPGSGCAIPLLLMELFTPNRNTFPDPTDQVTAAVGQAQALETYLATHGAGTPASTTYLMGYNYFEFNDEQDVKLTGLFQYGSSGTQASTGVTSVSYPPYSFSTATFPVYPLTPTMGPAGTGSLIDQLIACFPLEGTIVAAFGGTGAWQANFYTGSPIPSWVLPGMSAVGETIPPGTVVATQSPSEAPVTLSVVLTNPSSASVNPFTVSQDIVVICFT